MGKNKKCARFFQSLSRRTLSHLFPIVVKSERGGEKKHLRLNLPLILFSFDFLRNNHFQRRRREKLLGKRLCLGTTSRSRFFLSATDGRAYRKKDATDERRFVKRVYKKKPARARERAKENDVSWTFVRVIKKKRRRRRRSIALLSSRIFFSWHFFSFSPSRLEPYYFFFVIEALDGDAFSLFCR